MEPLSDWQPLLSSPCSLPDRFICSLSPSAVRNLSREEALGVAQRLGKSCPWTKGTPGERAPSSLAAQELQVSPRESTHLHKTWRG